MRLSRVLYLLPLICTVGCVDEYIDPCVDSDSSADSCTGGGTSGSTSATTGNPTTTTAGPTTTTTTEPTTGSTTTTTDATTMDPSDTETTETSSTTDPETTDGLTCENDPTMCIATDLVAGRCKEVGETCYKCSQSEGGCVDCDTVNACLGDCNDGVCGVPPCFIKGEGEDSCTNNLSCVGEGPDRGTCAYPRTCNELYQWGYRDSGMYWIDVDGDAPLQPFEVECDFGRTCGGVSGGWTKLSVQDVVTHLQANDVGEGLSCGSALCCVTQNLAGDAAPDLWEVMPEVSEVYGPHARHQEWANPKVYGHTCHFTFNFPFKEFAFEGYTLGGSCPIDKCKGQPLDMPMGWVRSWNNDDSTLGHGDIHFGTPDLGPMTSIGEVWAGFECFGGDGNAPTMCTTIEGVELDAITTTANNCYDIGEPVEDFRIMWGEYGRDSEGWAPWFGGKILFR